MAELVQKTNYRIGGMDCASCAIKIETALRRIEGIEDASVSVAKETLSLCHDKSSDLAAVEKLVRRLGYTIAPLVGAQALSGSSGGRHHGDARHSHPHSTEKSDASEDLHGNEHGPSTVHWWQSRKGQMTLACGGALLLAYGAGQLLPSIAPFAFVAAMMGGASMCVTARSPGSSEKWLGRPKETGDGMWRPTRHLTQGT